MRFSGGYCGSQEDEREAVCTWYQRVDLEFTQELPEVHKAFEDGRGRGTRKVQ